MSKKVLKGDSIAGERIAGTALKILPPRREGNKDRTKLERDAYCVVEVPLKNVPPELQKPRITLEEFAEIEAFKISAEAKYISEPEIFRRSSNHRGHKVTMQGEAFCVIDQPMKWVGR